MIERNEKEMFYLTTHSKHFIYGYMVKDHSDSEKGNQLLPHRLLFPISSKGSFICIRERDVAQSIACPPLKRSVV